MGNISTISESIVEYTGISYENINTIRGYRFKYDFLSYEVSPSPNESYEADCRNTKRFLNRKEWSAWYYNLHNVTFFSFKFYDYFYL